MVCTYLSREVAQIQGSAQVAGQKNRHKRRVIYSADSGGFGRGRFGSRGRGHGQLLGRSGGRCRGGSGWSSRGSEGMYSFNGVDISDPTHAFTNEEWTAIVPGGGRAHVTQQRMMINGCGRGRDAGKGGQVRGIDAVETVTEQEYVYETTGRGSHGVRNEVRFGRGGYRA